MGRHDRDLQIQPDDLRQVAALCCASLTQAIDRDWEAPAGTRAFHPTELADPSGFLSMGCDEILVHTADITQGLGTPFRPPDRLCERILARLFPWAPCDGDAWT